MYVCMYELMYELMNGTSLLTYAFLFHHITSHHITTHYREQAAAAIKEGEEQLLVLRRQVVIGNLYPSDTSVMESTVSIY